MWGGRTLPSSKPMGGPFLSPPGPFFSSLPASFPGPPLPSCGCDQTLNPKKQSKPSVAIAARYFCMIDLQKAGKDPILKVIINKQG